MAALYGGSGLTINPVPGTYTAIEGSIITISAAVPEPSTWAMMLLGFAGIGFAARHMRRLSANV
jgi:PEP-CTERM motif